MLVTAPVAIFTRFYSFIFCGIGCISCFLIQKHFEIPSVLASALVGLIGSFLPKLDFYDHEISIMCIYTGSFAAMCSLSFFSNSLYIFLLSLIVGVYFKLLSPYFKGFGGKLGSIAFFSSISFIFLLRFL